MINHKESLEEKLNEVMGQPFIKRKYYHHRSIENFIHFFNKVSSVQEREKIFFILNEYLDAVKQEPVEDASASLDLFNEYIRPIGKIYEEDFDFMPMINLWVICFWIAVAFLAIYTFNLSFIFYLITGIPLLAYYLFVLKKRISKKVYGCMW